MKITSRGLENGTVSNVSSAVKNSGLSNTTPGIAFCLWFVGTRLCRIRCVIWNLFAANTYQIGS